MTTPDAHQFKCAECGRAIVQVCGLRNGYLCTSCLIHPGWFRDRKLRAILDPSHDGIEVVERAIAAGTIAEGTQCPK